MGLPITINGYLTQISNCPRFLYPEDFFDVDLCDTCICNLPIVIEGHTFTLCGMIRGIMNEIEKKHQKEIGSYCSSR